MNNIPPTDVELQGYPRVFVVRHCADVVYYKDHPKELTELFHGCGVIRKEVPCKVPNCGGVATSIYNPQPPKKFCQHGGYYRQCKGGVCTSQKNTRRITYGTIFEHTKLTMYTFLCLMFSYAVASHAVKKITYL